MRKELSMKSILVIGIGKFGHHFAEKLIALGNEVMIIDEDEDKVESLCQRQQVQVGDCTDEDVLNSLGLSNFDTVVVCFPRTSRTVLKQQVL